jgi:hypothetical protein
MLTYTKEEFLAKIIEEFREEYRLIPGADELFSAPQYFVPHKKASGVALHIGYITERNETQLAVLALIISDKRVCFYNENSATIPVTVLCRHVRFIKPLDMLVGQVNHGRLSKLRSHIWAWFMQIGALGESEESKVITFKSFKAECKNMADAQRKETGDIMNDTERMDPDQDDES